MGELHRIMSSNLAPSDSNCSFDFEGTSSRCGGHFVANFAQGFVRPRPRNVESRETWVEFRPFNVRHQLQVELSKLLRLPLRVAAFDQLPVSVVQ